MSSDEETVARLEREVGEALARLDVEALRRFFADDFIGINPMSLEMTKADMLAQIGSSDYEPESIVNEVHRVRVPDHPRPKRRALGHILDRAKQLVISSGEKKRLRLAQHISVTNHLFEDAGDVPAANPARIDEDGETFGIEP